MTNPMFTKRHYEEIAKLLGEYYRQNGSFNQIEGAFAVMFYRDNKRFDYDKFMKAVSEHKGE